MKTQSNTLQTALKVEGMDCPSCIDKVEQLVRSVKGTSNISLSFTTQILTFDSEEGTDQVAQVEKNIRAIGYKVSKFEKSTLPSVESRQSKLKRLHNKKHGTLKTPSANVAVAEVKQEEHGHSHEHSPGGLRSATQRILLLGFAVILLFWLTQADLLDEKSPVLIGFTTLMALPTARRALLFARSGNVFSIEFLMIVASIGAMIIGETLEATLVVYLFLVGEYLEGFAAEKARSGISSLSKLLPDVAHRKIGDNLTTVPVHSLKVGDTIVVKPGELFPADGKVAEGKSHAMENLLTGETAPILKELGSEVYAGTTNSEGMLCVTVSKTQDENTLSRIIALVSEAETHRAKTARFIQSFSRKYTPVVFAVACAVAIFPFFFESSIPHSEWVYRALALLLIACPCALVLSTPAAIAASLAWAARNGLLIKGGAVLENLATIDAVAFDKTGTLTTGKVRVSEFLVFDADKTEVLTLAASVENGTTHPLANAFVDYAGEHNLKLLNPNNVELIPGVGVEGSVANKRVVICSPESSFGKSLSADSWNHVKNFRDRGLTVSCVFVEDKLCALVGLLDLLRPEANQVITTLRKKGFKTLVLTGDHPKTAETVCAPLGLEVYAKLSPAEKLEKIKLLSQKHTVAMVGDGYNDVPALAAAQVGIVVASSGHAALEMGDAVLVGNTISGLPRLFSLAKSTLTNIKQNIVLALGLKAVFLVTSILGVTTLWMAIFADTGATVLVTLNALRILLRKA